MEIAVAIAAMVVCMGAMGLAAGFAGKLWSRIARRGRDGARESG